ncbi:aldo/keto reductase [Microlunatus parietis]|uniref:Aryl-alcohol dehydrogenase-like predicted oxidoreductase n=1 Tax=Microlunatus parietis TaxID=682979 RepID=A0A7Y9I5M5_9ACTN|nr:aldo/keto reductase [Microlunatus parietis]NYE70745.1 aryl-alcohol dehydrogenase-like predicted oxidoreductase [Microlunatus parietis]
MVTATRSLGRTDIKITPIGLGCMQFAGAGLIARLFYAPLEQPVVTEIVDAALRAGTGWFDTAEMYGRGRSERALTTALRDLGVAPGEVPIATKWSPGLRTAGSIVRTIDDRLAALQGYPIDLHQIHLPHGSFSSLTAQLKAMARLAREHKINSIGVSNFSARQLELAHSVLSQENLVLASNQVQINLLHRNIEKNGVLDVARRHGITLIAYSPLRSGLLTGRFHDQHDRSALLPFRRLVGGFDTRTLRRTAPLIKELERIGLAHGASASQVALAWLITFYGDTVVAIPGASKPSQATQAAEAMSLELSADELTRLDQLSRSAEA